MCLNQIIQKLRNVNYVTALANFFWHFLEKWFLKSFWLSLSNLFNSLISISH